MENIVLIDNLGRTIIADAQLLEIVAGVVLDLDDLMVPSIDDCDHRYGG